MELYNREQIQDVVSLDRDALEAVEAGFRALGEGNVVQPPILSMAIEEANGEVDVKTAYIPGFDGFAIFARDMDMTLNNPCWKKLQAPWQKAEESAEQVAASA